MSVLFFFIFEKIINTLIMTRQLNFLLVTVFTMFQLNAQDNLWPELPVNTGTNSTYLVQTANFNNTDVFFGYTLGAFYTNDDGELTCGGFQVWNGIQTSISVMADDSTTDEKDGFTSGEEITWLATFEGICSRTKEKHPTFSSLRAWLISFSCSNSVSACFL